MIKPVNKHILIEPIEQESFMATNDTKFQEIGVVLAVADDLLGPALSATSSSLVSFSPVKVGDKVYFDAWLAAKFPKNKDEFYWLVQWEDVRAIQHAEPETV